MSKAKKLMTKTNRSQAGIINMVSNISTAVGYSNVVPFLEHDASNMTSATNSIHKHNKDMCSRKHCSIIDGNIPIDANVTIENINNNKNKNNHNKNRNSKNNNNNVDDDNDGDDDDDNGDIDDEADAYVDGETDSLASMETLSDNVAIWVDGERHWVSGVDANTTCMDLICALLNYQNGQCEQMFNHDTDYSQDNLNDYHDRNTGNIENPNNNRNIVGNIAINQSMPSKDGKQESIQTTVVYQDVERHGKQNCGNTKATLLTLERSVALSSEYVIVKQHRHCEEYLDGNTKVFDVLPGKAEGIVNSSGGGIGVANRKECELYLRRLVSNTAMSIEGHAGTTSPSNVGNTQVASLLSTDKDSGMGSPVGSSRSARFRRRKYKSATWLSQGNTLHPKATQRGSGLSAAAIANAASNTDNIANERLMRIILAQDETIHRQLSLLREKERQISRIEEEKHRVREREIGKNYLLETYFKGLDEAVCEPDQDGEEEIFIDEPYQRIPENIEATATIGMAQHRSSRHSKKLNAFHQQFRHHQQHFNQFGNNSSSDGVKVNNSFAANAEDRAVVAECVTTPSVAVADMDAAADAAVDNKKEIELQIFWLEKVYALNKQLQREEETLLKLHAKIRKHQVRCAYQMKNDVLEQIDELDTKLALQCTDICHVEDNLMTSNEQLKDKLSLIEKLNAELQEIQEVISTPNSVDVCYEGGIKNCDAKSKVLSANVDVGAEVNVEIGEVEIRSRKRKPIVEPSSNVEPIMAAVVATKQQLSFGDGGERNELQNMAAEVNETVESSSTAIVSPMTKLTLTASAMYSSLFNQHQQLQNLNEPTQQQQQLNQHNYPISRVNQFEQSSAIAANKDTNVNGIKTQATVCDKNMLPLQHMSNVKIVKKPIHEASSLNQMSSAAAAVSVAVTCQQQLPNSVSAAHISSVAVPLNDGTNSIDLSRLGTLV